MAEVASTLRRKLPEILIEGVFVVLAILLALAADEWRENRERLEIADRALEGIEAEMRLNREELEDSRGPNAEFMELLGEQAQSDELLDSLSLQFEYSLLTDAAWETAQVTQAIHYADYDLIQQVARLYDLQDLFVQNQRRVVDEMSGTMAQLPSDPQGFARNMVGRIGVLRDVEAGLTAVLDSMIVVMENR